MYRVEQKNPRRVVALKLLQLGAMRDDIRARFLREAELLARLQHPGIAQRLDAGSIPPPENHCLPLVTPGLAPTCAPFLRVKALISADLRTLGMPTTKSLGSRLEPAKVRATTVLR